MSTINIICADVLGWCAEYEGPKFHALLADAPYQYGFMGRSWDSTGITYQPETWAALAEHLHSGAFLMVFGGARSWHRLAVAMEDAGLIIHPTIFVYLQGQGFPKATRIDSQIQPKNEQRDMGPHPNARTTQGNINICKKDGDGRLRQPTNSLARAWQSHRYGLQALKPAVEPIIVAQKPYSGKPVDSIVETGAGALNIDGGRVAGAGWQRQDKESGGGFKKDKFMGSIGLGEHTQQHCLRQSTQGRWPPNFCLVHISSHYRCTQCQAVHPIQPVIEVCPDCGGELEHVEGCKRVGVKRMKGGSYERIQRQTADEGKGRSLNTMMRPGGYVTSGYADPDGKETVADFRCLPECPARRLDEQAGIQKNGDGQVKISSGTKREPGWSEKKGLHTPGRTNIGIRDFGDSGGASRFYPNADWQHEVAEQLAQADPVRYCPKSPKKERNSGLDDFYWQRDKASPTGFVRVNQEEWEALPKRQRARGNIHSTVKPLSLLKWIAALLLPPPEYTPRRVLVPFSGSGSEAISAALVGFEDVVAVEMLQDYVDISEARAAFWLTRQPALL